MRTALIAIAAITAIGAPAATFAQASADGADARCVLVLGLLGRDPSKKEVAAQAMYYYLGRIDARGQTPRLEALMQAEGNSINSKEQLQSELTRCGAQVQKSATQLEAAYKDLRAKAQAAQPAARPATK